MAKRDLININDFTVEEIDAMLRLADDIIANPQRYSEKCKGKKLATLFFEPSTRTRLSLESAMIELGGSVIGFSDADSSSSVKGESIADTVRVVEYYADIIAMRHHKEGAALVAAEHTTVPVINAGDGGHLHPTQTLADLLTIKREKGRLDNFRIGFCGDLKFGRTVHSLIEALLRYSEIDFMLISPEELRLPEYMKEKMSKAGADWRETTSFEEAVPWLDVLYMTRVQKERFFNEEDYIRLRDTYILDNNKLRTAREELVIMHPLPRVNEISVEIDSDPRAKYFEQVKNGKYVRMALMLMLLGIEGGLNI